MEEIIFSRIIYIDIALESISQLVRSRLSFFRFVSDWKIFANVIIKPSLMEIHFIVLKNEIQIENVILEIL